MADTKITGLAALTSLATGDLSVWVDVSDTAMDAGGTDKKVTLADVAAAVLASPTTTGTTTIGTLTGLLKGATGVVSAASAGTDYLAPAAIGVGVQAYDADLTAIAGLADPAADRILVWDDSAGSYAYLTAGTGLDITGTTITATATGLTVGGAITSGTDDRVLYQASGNLAQSANFTYNGTTLTLRGTDSQINLTDGGGTQGGYLGRHSGTGGLGISATIGDLNLGAGGSAGDVVLSANNAGQVIRTTGSGFVVGTAALATTATDGFPWIPTCPGPPTGTPSPTFTGRVPLVIDSSSSPKKLYAYVGGAWIGASLS
jgi:hypothetical protein